MRFSGGGADNFMCKHTKHIHLFTTRLFDQYLCFHFVFYFFWYYYYYYYYFTLSSKQKEKITVVFFLYGSWRYVPPKYCCMLHSFKFSFINILSGHSLRKHSSWKHWFMSQLHFGKFHVWQIGILINSLVERNNHKL